jgi:hypothetical protein
MDQSEDTYWTTSADDETATIDFDLESVKMFDRAMLMENIEVGQRVESFYLEAFSGGAWKEFARGTTIGYKRLLRFPTVTTPRVRLVIERSRTNPTLSSFGLFKSPPVVTIEPPEGSFEKEISVRLSCDTEGADIYYTLDGSDPTLKSIRYASPISLVRTAVIKAAAAMGNELCAELASAQFTQCLKVESATFEKPPSQKYPGMGSSTIIDGKRGSIDFQDKRWVGFNGDDVIVTLDLGAVKTVNEVSIGFLQQQGSWIFLPKAIKIAVSTDGENWNMLADIDNSVAQSERVFVKDFSFSTGGIQTRFIKLAATNIGTCPGWHAGAGDKSWLFVDEAVVR